MTPPFFLIDALPDGERAELAGSEGRHAATVRRIRAGERVHLGDGAGGIAECTVRAVLPGGLALDVQRRRTVPAPDPWLVVVQALAKGDRGERAVELLTELGVDEIVPWAAGRSVVRWEGERGGKALARWRSTAREATKQSRRARLPRLSERHDSVAVTALLAAADTSVVLHEAADRPLGDVTLCRTGRVLVVVGPEGGVTGDELTAFAAAGAVPARLGPEVLRTSTAGAAALAVLSARLGRWS
ncbi:16S rRNA (uracil(1498)-N(3))-methyltransferase [soil metagenome]